MKSTSLSHNNCYLLSQGIYMRYKAYSKYIQSNQITTHLFKIIIQDKFRKSTKGQCKSFSIITKYSSQNLKIQNTKKKQLKGQCHYLYIRLKMTESYIETIANYHNFTLCCDTNINKARTSSRSNVKLEKLHVKMSKTEKISGVS